MKGWPVAAKRLPERVEGPRLLLRRWTPADEDLLASAVARNIDHLRPWMPWATEDTPVEGPRQLLESWEREWKKGGDVVMAIFLGGRVAGGTGLHRRRGPGVLEIGYWVDKDLLGQGIATEASAMLTSAALLIPGISSVEIHHDKANVRSGQVPRRLGYELVCERAEALKAPAESGVELTWRMTAEHWAARQADSTRR